LNKSDLNFNKPDKPDLSLNKSARKEYKSALAVTLFVVGILIFLEAIKKGWFSPQAKKTETDIRIN
jgi:hypothetical protein